MDKKTFIVAFVVDGECHLIEVEAKDKINAVIDAIWPVTVWSKEEWNAQPELTEDFPPRRIPKRRYFTDSAVSQ